MFVNVSILYGNIKLTSSFVLFFYIINQIHIYVRQTTVYPSSENM